MTVYRMTEVVGTSGTSVTDAIRAAIQRVGAEGEESGTGLGGEMRWFEVQEIRGRLDGQEVAEFQVKLSVATEVPATTATSARTSRAGSRQARSQAAQVAAKGGDRRRTDLARGFERQGGSRRRG